MKAVIIFDSTGRIWSTAYGEESAPSGLKAMLTDIPDDVQSVDGINMHTGQPIFTFIPQAKMDHYDEKVSEMIKEVRDIFENFQSTARVFAENLTDEQALRVSDIYPEWSPDMVHYRVNDRVRFRNKLWRVLQEHDSQDNWTPNYAPSLFVEVIDGDGGIIPDWIQPGSENGYNTGQEVYHNGKHYRSLIDANVWEPGILGSESLWAEVIDGE